MQNREDRKKKRFYSEWCYWRI